MPLPHPRASARRRAARQPARLAAAVRPRRRSRRGGGAVGLAPGGVHRRCRRHRQDAAGAGGCTRLHAETPEGRWWVELAPLADAALVPATIASALGLQLARRPAAGARRWPRCSRRHRALIVLDNCEHVADAVAGVIACLRAQAPGVRLLITSQELLKCVDEQVYRLAPLALPDDADAADPDAASRCGAVALFIARAHAADPRFALGADNVAAVIDICRRLDGIPLAIELAAARVPMLGVQGLLARLDQMFNVLTGGRAHDAAPPPDAARRARMELRPAHRRRARGVPPARGVRRRLHAGAGAGRGRRRAHRRLAGAGPPVAADRQVAGARRRRGRAALPAARADARLRAGEAGRSRRIGRAAAPPCRDDDDAMAAFDRGRWTWPMPNGCGDWWNSATCARRLDWAMRPEGDRRLAIRLAPAAGSCGSATTSGPRR